MDENKNAVSNEILAADVSDPVLTFRDFKASDMPTEGGYGLGLQLPVLVLGIKIDFKLQPRQPAFKPGREWLNIMHQVSGHACHQVPIVGTVLKPKNVEVLRGMSALEAEYLDSELGWGPSDLTLTALNKYRSRLIELLAVDCDYSYGDLREGIYPIDRSQKYLERLTDEKFPQQMDDLLADRGGWKQARGVYGRWGLWVLGKNCD